MPIKESQANQHVMFVLTKFGSHCGHMQGWWPLGQSWLDVITMEFFRAILVQGGRHPAPPSMDMRDLGKDLSAADDLSTFE